MTNQPTPRYTYLSHLLISVGILFLSIFIFQTISERISLALWDVKTTDIDFSAGQFSVSDIYALKLSQCFLGFGFIFTVFICLKVFKQDFLAFSNINKAVVPWLLLGAVVMYFGFIPFSNWLLNMNQGITLPESWAEKLQEQELRNDQMYAALLKFNSGASLIGNLFLMAIVPAISEELLFRGLLLRIFKSWTRNLHWAVFLTSLLFALLHLQPYKLIPMIALSAILCYAYYLTGSLWVPIILHAINNALVVFADAFARDNSNFDILDNEFNFPVWAVALSVLVTLSSAYYMWKHSKNKLEFDFE